MTAVAVENFRRAAALGYAADGWLVVPLHWPRIGVKGTSCSCGKADCGSVGKHPLTASGLKDASADPVIVSGWWDQWPSANVGIVTGAGSGVVVLDIDPRDGGNETLAELGDEHGQLPETVEANTGGGGMHLFFAHPGGIVRNSAGKVGPGIDVRGDGGYVVAPPSLHASGKRYAWALGADPAAAKPVALPAWLLAVLVEKPKPAAVPRELGFADDAGRHWLGKALAKTEPGQRNNTGHWLACQLRDNRVPLYEAEFLMIEYAERCPRGEVEYTKTEAIATVRSMYSSAPRQPAKSGTIAVRPSAPRPVEIQAPQANAATELREYLHSVADGRVVDARMPWPLLSRWSCSMLPGTVTAVVGDPGVGKTFLTLECLRFWHGNGHDVAVFFVEKDRRFHSQRLLAQLEGNGRFVDYEWLPGKVGEIDAALERHGGYIADLGKCIHSASGDDVSLTDLLNWVRQMCSAGKRVLVIDPVTAADAGRERWEADRQFMVTAQKVCAVHGTSLVLVTHPRRGNRPASGATLHDVAGGAAFVRLADTVLWLNKPKKPRRVKLKMQSSVGVKSTVERIGLFMQLHKTRNGMGNGMELAYSFGEGLRFCEHGIVTGEVRDGEEGEAA